VYKTRTKAHCAFLTSRRDRCLLSPDFGVTFQVLFQCCLIIKQTPHISFNMQFRLLSALVILTCNASY